MPANLLAASCIILLVHYLPCELCAVLASISKAEILEQLSNKLRSGRVLPLYRIPVRHWNVRDKSTIAAAQSFLQLNAPLIVRSSSADEDLNYRSNAGVHQSIKNICTWSDLVGAIDKVIASYKKPSDGDEVLLQPLARNVKASGVVMTRDPETSSPYFIIEYSTSEDTSLVTSGVGQVRTLILINPISPTVPEVLRSLLPAVEEIVSLFGDAGVDIEFAVTSDSVIIFQCRPITSIQSTSTSIPRQALLARATAVAERIKASLTSEPAGCRGRTVFGVMPDWNPAEMIGLKPRALALSLYEFLITDCVWSQARAAYGYANLGHYPLLSVFGGTPFVDVRASCASFVPASIPNSLMREIVDASIERLRRNPDLFDKLEFAVIPTCYTPSLETASHSDWGIGDEANWQTYIDALQKLTRDIVRPGGLFESDLAKVDALGATISVRQRRLADLNPILVALQGIDEVRSIGTPYFARVARASFIATALIKSLEKECGPDCCYEHLLPPVQTVASTIAYDFQELSQSDFLERHGHIRPGTYDVRISRYDEEPEKYFDWKKKLRASGSKPTPTSPYDYALADRCLKSSRLEIDLDSLVTFAQRAIAARESAKYHFTRLLSDALHVLTRYVMNNGLSRDELSFVSLSDLRQAAAHENLNELSRIASNRRSQWEDDTLIRLPALITSSEDPFAFDQGANPNFITREIAEGPVTTTEAANLHNSIILLESADPGFDWIFARGIAGFITAYGGENSHMAIRAREFGMPAVIGVGETHFRRLKSAHSLRLDCSSRVIEVLS